MVHHGATLRRITSEDSLVHELRTDPRTAPLDARSRVFVDYALKLTLSPRMMRLDDVTPLRDAGLSDACIHDLNAVTAYFNFVNRVAQGLGLELEEGIDQGHA